MLKTVPFSSIQLRVLGASLLLAGSACGAARALATVEVFVEAFNRHDVDAMAALVANDFELYYVDEEGETSLAVYEVRGGLIRRAWYFPAED